MKTELPKKWYIVCTEENRDILNGWRLTVATNYYSSKYFKPDHILVSKHHNDDGSYYYSDSVTDSWFERDYGDYEELTLEEFKLLVLGENSDSNYEIY